MTRSQRAGAHALSGSAPHGQDGERGGVGVTAPTATGRLLPFQDGPGTEHMALDVALLRRAAHVDARAALRFYRWTPPAVSIGYGQRDAARLGAACAPHGWEVVRRPTGGRGILHRGSLTYAIVLPPGGVWGAWSVPEATQRIHDGLARGLRRLGIGAALRLAAGGASRWLPHGADRNTIGAPGNEAWESACCLLRPAPADLVVDGRRLGGSAQRRKGGAILQQGILLLADEVEAWRAAFGLRPDAARRLAESTATLAGLCPGLDQAWVAAALARGLGEALGIAWFPAALEPDTMAEASALLAQTGGEVCSGRDPLGRSDP